MFIEQFLIDNRDFGSFATYTTIAVGVVVAAAVVHKFFGIEESECVALWHSQRSAASSALPPFA